jgi:solute carrier family 10 (sodium/bile acid cotransporter), member 7
MIFLLSGLSLETSELTKAATNLKLNGLIQLVIFGAWPALIGVPLTWSLRTFLPTLIPPALVDGLLILTCLPTTVNMNIMLSSAGGGSVATSIINSVIANMGGIFLTPALLLHFFGTEITLPFLAMVAKLCNKVLLPVGEYVYLLFLLVTWRNDRLFADIMSFQHSFTFQPLVRS